MHDGFTIDRNVPPPRERSYPRQKYPFGEMEPGDSFFVPAQEGLVQSPYERTHNALYRWRKKSRGGRFVIRRVKENGKLGARCWRVK